MLSTRKRSFRGGIPIEWGEPELSEAARYGGLTAASQQQSHSERAEALQA
jgi:hypothetical protein